MDCSFFIWKYRFTQNRIFIHRKTWFTRTNVIDIEKIEMVSSVSSLLMRAMGRCNLVLMFAGNIFTLIGVPQKTADRFYARFEDCDDPGEKITLKNIDILKLSVFQSHTAIYIGLLILLWSAVIIISIPYLSVELAKTVSDTILRHMLIGGTLILSIGLPYVLIFLWAITGGLLKEYLKYYKYTSIRRQKSLSFEYGLIIHRKFIFQNDRIVIAEYRQTPLMRAVGYGKLYIRAIGYNPYFGKWQPLLPFLKKTSLHKTMRILMPEMSLDPPPKRKRRFRYYLITPKWLLLLLLIPPIVWISPKWFLPLGILGILIFFSILLEYFSTLFEADQSLTVLSRGGYVRTVSCVYTPMIERIAVKGSRYKRRKGYVNVLIHVFGKNGTFAKVRNIPIDQLEYFRIPEEDDFESASKE